METERPSGLVSLGLIPRSIDHRRKYEECERLTLRAWIREMKSWMTSVAMYMAIVGIAVVAILTMSALGLLT